MAEQEFEFEWDEAKARSNLEKHGVSFFTAAATFRNERLETIDDREDYGEVRWIALGRAGTEVYRVIYTWRSENQIRIEVRNAQFGVEQNRASVVSAQAAVDYAKQSLDAEQKKYQFGTSTTTLVLQTQSGLATAESTLMSAMAAYEKSRIELDRAIGVTLDHAGISIDDAAKGRVNRMPSVPYIAPRKELPSVTPPPPQTPAPQQPQ